MRKSRAWDTKHSCYLEHGFDFRIDGDGYVYRRVFGETGWVRTCDLIIEYSTGLKDKNGKEIHEGDIYIHNDIKYEVVWSNGGFIGKSKKYCSHEFIVHLLDIEIIGDIHITPELLKESK